MQDRNIMRVMIVQHGIFPGFVAPIAKEWAKNLFQLGVDVSVVTIGSRSAQVAAEPLNFPVHCIDNSNTFRMYSRLKKVLENCDLVHYFPGKQLELMPLLNRRVKYIFNHISVSVTGNRTRDSLINFVKRLQPLFADLVLCTDAELASALRPVGSTAVEIMPVGYAEDLFFPCPPVDHSTADQNAEKELIYHGAVRPQRRLDQLIEVLSRLPNEYVLTIIGGGAAADEEYRGYLATVAKRLNCSDRLNLTNMPQAKIRAVICRAYMGLSYVPMLECFQDQFVLKTLEYLACQRPVMATATRYTKQFSQSIGNGRILLADDRVDDMVNKIVGAADYVRGFYAPQNLSSLPAVLAPYSSRHLVQTKLLPIYQRLVNS
jgi:glycosyltransferase involved in cell wall biosynthesis